MSSSRKLILYIAMSVDGYIATEDGDISFLNVVGKEGEDYGYQAFVDTTDAVIIGRKTYEKVLSMGFEYPHTDKDVYLVTRTPRPSVGNIHFYTGSLVDLVTELKSQSGKHIYCDGGGEIVQLLLRENLMDEMIISVIPTMLGGGIALFQAGRPSVPLQLLAADAFDTGLVQLHYRVVKD